jgi:hypothetical protein
VAIIYAVPFILLAFCGCVVCAIVPRWRRYALYALIVPPAFAASAIIGMFTVVIVFVALKHRIHALEGPWLLLLIPLYILPGIAGAWIAISLAKVGLKLVGLSNGNQNRN